MSIRKFQYENSNGQLFEMVLTVINCIHCSHKENMQCPLTFLHRELQSMAENKNKIIIFISKKEKTSQTLAGIPAAFIT